MAVSIVVSLLTGVLAGAVVATVEQAQGISSFVLPQILDSILNNCRSSYFFSIIFFLILKSFLQNKKVLALQKP